MRKQTSLAVLTVILMMVVGVGSSTAFAHGRRSPIPASCFFTTYVQTVKNITINGSVIGTYRAQIKQNSCQSTDRLGAGRMDLTGGGCVSGTIAVTVTINSVKFDSGSANSGSVGPNGCSTTFLDWESTDYVGNGVTICVTAHATYAGNSLSPDAVECHSF